MTVTLDTIPNSQHLGYQDKLSIHTTNQTFLMINVPCHTKKYFHTNPLKTCLQSDFRTTVLK